MASKIIFLDTSIFVQENFLEGGRIKTIFNLASRGHFELYLSKITLNEIKGQFKKRVQAALIKHNELINDKSSTIRVLRNNSKGKVIIQKLPNEKQICQEFNDRLDEELNDAGATILDYPVLNIGSIFDEYFTGNAPFNHADKKNEFPDAFAIAHIEQWCSDEGKSAIVLSKDKDFSTRKSKHFKVIYKYEEFIADTLKTIESKRISRLEMLFELKSAAIDTEILDWVKDELQDDSIYIDAVNWMDVHSIDIKKLKILSKDYLIIGDDQENIEIQVNAKIEYKLALEIDDEETGIYDNEDHVMLFRESKNIEIEDTELIIPVKINFNILDEDDYDEDFSIMEINNSKDIKIKNDHWDDY